MYVGTIKIIVKIFYLSVIVQQPDAQKQRIGQLEEAA